MWLTKSIIKGNLPMTHCTFLSFLCFYRYRVKWSSYNRVPYAASKSLPSLLTPLHTHSHLSLLNCGYNGIYFSGSTLVSSVHLSSLFFFLTFVFHLSTTSVYALTTTLALPPTPKTLTFGKLPPIHPHTPCLCCASSRQFAMVQEQY